MIGVMSGTEGGIWDVLDHMNLTVVVILGIMAVMVPLVKASITVGKFASEFMRDWRGEPSRPGFEGRPGIPAMLLLFGKEMRDLRETTQGLRTKMVRHHLLLNWLIDRMRLLEEHLDIPHEPLPKFGDDERS